MAACGCKGGCTRHPTAFWQFRERAWGTLSTVCAHAPGAAAPARTRRRRLHKQPKPRTPHTALCHALWVWVWAWRRSNGASRPPHGTGARAHHFFGHAQAHAGGAEPVLLARTSCACRSCLPWRSSDPATSSCDSSCEHTHAWQDASAASCACWLERSSDTCRRQKGRACVRVGGCVGMWCTLPVYRVGVHGVWGRMLQPCMAGWSWGTTPVSIKSSSPSSSHGHPTLDR